MVAIQGVADVEKVERDDVSGVLLRDQVRAGKVKDRVTGRWCFSCEDLVLVISHDHFRVQQQSLVSQLESDSTAQWRNARQWGVALCKFGVHIVQAQVEPDGRMKRSVKPRLSA